MQKQGFLCYDLYALIYRILGYFLMRSISQEPSVLTQCLFLWHGYVCRGAVSYTCLLPALRGLPTSGHSWRWLRSPLEAASGTAVVTPRGLCHPLLPLQSPSPLQSQSLLFLLLSLILILQNSWFKTLVIKENCIYNLC